MRIFLITFLYTAILQVIAAQDTHLDSLRNVLDHTTKPAERFDALVKVLEYKDSYSGINIDSADCETLLIIAQEENNESMLATAYNWIGYFLFIVKGDNTAALEYYFKALPLAEKFIDKRRISSLYFDIANVYTVLLNSNEAYRYTLKGGQYLPDPSSGMYDYMLVQYQRNLARYYSDTRQLDSALYYVSALTQTSLRANLIYYTYQAMFLNGFIRAQMGENESADACYKKALLLSDSIKVEARKLPFYNRYIAFLIANDRLQDAQHQTQELWHLAMRTNNPNLKLAAASFKRDLFERLQQIDSAYYYSRVEASTSEFIFNQHNQNIIQALAFKDQLRSIEEEGRRTIYQNNVKQYALLTGLGVFTIIALMLFRNNLSRKKANTILQRQKTEIETQKVNVEKALIDLKSTQAQLIQSEKMASLGELTAGIAHEIQNPLNFVNNFSEVNTELIDELKIEMDKQNLEEARTIAENIKDNQEKITLHGKRADDIVKGMLQHSRSSSGIKESTDINALADEYLRLAYHGLRAKDKSFNATIKSDFDESIGMINLVPQDIGRVILNLITNAFYAVSMAPKSPKGDLNYEPTVTVTTKLLKSPLGDLGAKRSTEDLGANIVTISVSDNGPGIPKEILDKIFQPFFTTKPTGQGTGLGLSLSYDIIKAHGGVISLNTKEGEGTEFIIKLPAA